MLKTKVPTWIDFAILSKSGAPIAELANVIAALRHDPDLQGIFGFDEFRQETVMLQTMPSPLHDGTAQPLTDAIVGKLQDRLQRDGLSRIDRATVHQAIDLHAFEWRIHPLRDWLDSLEWDGVPRVNVWQTFYLGAERNQYTEQVGRMFLVSMIARVFDPGCKADHMLVWEGAQGILKSTAARVLAGDEYFSDSLPDIQSSIKDARAHLHGRWLVEIAELASFSRAEAAHLKSFLTCQVDVFRPPYGRLDVRKPRSCVFVGTTNESSYLKDRTGGRRFWPVKCGEIDIDALAADREQLFAEAVRLWAGGIKWWPDRDFEREHIAKEQESRREVDPWMEIVGPYLAGRTSVTLTDLAQQCLDIRAGNMGTRERNRLVSVLEECGWHRTEKQDPSNRRQLFMPRTV